MKNICGAKTRSGAPCQRSPMTNGRCYLHGGATPKGIASAGYKHGKYSKYLPGRLRERYEEFISDPEITKTTNEIGLLDSRISELANQVDSDESDRTWKKLHSTWTQFMYAIRVGDTQKQTDLLNKIDEMINDRVNQNTVWEDIERLSLSRTRLAEAEQRRLVQNNQMLSVEQAMTLIGALITSIKDVVYLYADPTTAKHIIIGTSEAYSKLIGGAPSTIDVDSRTLDG